MRWITLTQTQRWHAHRHSSGTGPVYQGRFKSFPFQTDDHFLTVARYVERNALRAKLVERAEDWQWFGAYRSVRHGAKLADFLSLWPTGRGYVRPLRKRGKPYPSLVSEIKSSGSL